MPVRGVQPLRDRRPHRGGEHPPGRRKPATRSRNATQLVATDDKAPGFSRGVVYQYRAPKEIPDEILGETLQILGCRPKQVEHAGTPHGYAPGQSRCRGAGLRW